MTYLLASGKETNPEMQSDPSQTRPPAGRLRPVWAAAGLLALAVGIVGIFLPVLPTTPLVLLAAFCFGKGSPRLRGWITGHRRFGPMIADWETTGAIPRRVKIGACSVMALTLAVSGLLGVPARVLVIQALAMACGAYYVLTRPDR
ncbi:YbaN family protein [Pseudooceanicola lipolyticus]|nr:YbaN family protein [Pseudooceanicola lipolyticus]